MTYETIRVQFQDRVCFLQINRPDANNTINSQLVAECHQVLSACEESATIIVLSGSPEVFCFGADFKGIASTTNKLHEQDGGPLYDLWLRLATGRYVTISHVRGKANAGTLSLIDTAGDHQVHQGYRLNFPKDDRVAVMPSLQSLSLIESAAFSRC